MSADVRQQYTVSTREQPAPALRFVLPGARSLASPRVMWLTLVTAACAAAFIVAGRATGFIALTLSAAMSIALVPRLSATRVPSRWLVVGDDGVLLHDRRHERFIHFTDIGEVGNVCWPETVWQYLGLRLANGEVVTIRTSDVCRHCNPNAARVSGDDIAEAVERRRKLASHDAPLQLDVLARSDRSPNAWLRHLRNLAESARAGYRHAPLTVAALWGIAQDRSLPPWARSAACVTLQAAGEPGLEHLGAIASSFANPHDYKQLARIANHSDRGKARALELLSQRT